MRQRAIHWMCVASLLVSAPLTAQQLRPGTMVRVRAPVVLTGRLDGFYIGHSGDTAIFGTLDRGQVRIPLAAITALRFSTGKSRWRGAMRGALWGGPIGLAAFWIGNLPPPLAERDTSRKKESLSEGYWFGAFTGAVVGAFIPKRVWRRRDPRLVLTRASLPSGRVGARVAFSF